MQGLFFTPLLSPCSKGSKQLKQFMHRRLHLGSRFWKPTRFSVWRRDKRGWEGGRFHSTWLMAIPVPSAVPGSSLNVPFLSSQASARVLRKHHFPMPSNARSFFFFLTATENEKARILSTCRGFTLHKAALKRITSKLLTATVRNNVGLSVGESQDLCLRIKSEWKGRLF